MQPNIEHEINIDACSVPGFQIMQNLYSHHVDIVEIYYLLFSLLFGSQKIRELPENANVSCFWFDGSF